MESIGGDLDGENPGDQSGTSVALANSGRILAVGAPKINGGETQASHARVYDLANNQWELRAIDINGATKYEKFGSSVALSTEGDTLAVGAPEFSPANNKQRARFVASMTGVLGRKHGYRERILISRIRKLGSGQEERLICLAMAIL
jgi:hypothetical protein